MSRPKSKRNQTIIKLRNKDPKTWSFGKLSQEFNLAKPTVFNIVKRQTTNAKSR